MLAPALRILRRPAVRISTASVAVVVTVAGIAVAGLDRGYPAEQVRLLSGSAWLASPQAGQVTLLDGSSAEVAAQLQVAPAGNRMNVVQHGSTAYAIDQTAGTIRRIDGATFELTQPESPIPDARDGLTAFASPNTVYALDTQRGVVATTDPRTLTARGQPLSLAAKLDTGSATVDDAGRLWAVDNENGDLISIAGDRRTTYRNAAKPGRSELTLAGGHPIIVDHNDRKAIVVDPDTGEIGNTIGLDLRADDSVAVSGSPHARRLYLVASRGLLAICDLDASACDGAVPLDAADSELGPAVEAGNRLFIPDYATGKVWIIDLAGRNVVAKPEVLTPPARFQLLTRDGIVFYNDPTSERAGVIEVDGGVRKVAKYDPKDPNKGLSAPPTTGNSTSPNQPPPNEPPPNQGPPDQPPQGQQPPPIQPPGNQPPGNQPPTNRPPPNQPPTTTQPSTTTPPATQPVLQITLSKTNPQVNEAVALQVSNTTGPSPTTASWDFGDSTTATGVTTSHSWAAARTYQVSVQATVPGGQQATTSISITVTPLPTFKLTVTSPTGGTVSGNGVSCPPTCSVNLDVGTQVTLTATPRPYYVQGAWGGACSGTAATCTFTMDANKTVSKAFPDTAASEDCINYDPNTLQIVDLGAQGYRLVSGPSGSMWMKLLDNLQDAQNALSVARGHNQQCFVGRGTTSIMQYWKGGAGAPGPVSPEDCIPYNKPALQVVQESATQWLLTDGSSRMEVFTTQDRAVRGLRVAQAAPNSRQCFIGRGNSRPNRSAYIMGYWR